MENNSSLFQPYVTTSTAPDPRTTNAGTWSDFLRQVIGIGATEAQKAIEKSQGTGGYAGNGLALPNGAAPDPAGGNAAGLLVIVLIVILVALD